MIMVMPKNFQYQKPVNVGGKNTFLTVSVKTFSILGNNL